MQVVPLTPVPSQTFDVQLANQSCRLSFYQKSTGMFMDVFLSGTLVIGGVLCQNKNRIVRSLYLGFSGDFIFVDTQGDANPDYTGLGRRFVLIYLEAADLPPGQG